MGEPRSYTTSAATRTRPGPRADPGHTAAAATALASDGTGLAVSDDGGRVAVWLLTERRVVATVDTGLHSPLRRLALSDDGRYLVARTTAGLGVWAIGNPDPLINLDCDDQSVFRFLSKSESIAVRARWSRAARLVARRPRGVVSLWARGSGDGTGRLPRTGEHYVSGSITGEVRLWDVRTGVSFSLSVGTQRQSR